MLAVPSTAALALWDEPGLVGVKADVGDFAAFAGRGFGVDLLEVDGNETGVDLGGGDLAVSEQFLDVADAGAASEKDCGAWTPRSLPTDRASFSG